MIFPATMARWLGSLLMVLFKAVACRRRLRLASGELRREEPRGGEVKGDMSRLLIGRGFASGRRSRIYHGTYEGEQVAIKMLVQPEGDHLAAAGDGVIEALFNSEVALLRRLHHPNIITLVSAFKKPPVFCIITEYMAGGSLRKYLHKQEPYSLPLKLVLKLALGIARGMSYLHSQGILHRDLKSENILLGDGADMCVKVADFGISCLESQCRNGKGFISTYRWMAPEIIKAKHHTRKVDVYSYGIVLWELLTALTPFQNMTPEQAAFAVIHKNARPPLPLCCPKALSYLIDRCWANNPDKRPHFDEIVSILESYLMWFEQDPRILLYYQPDQEPPLTRMFS